MNRSRIAFFSRAFHCLICASPHFSVPPPRTSSVPTFPSNTCRLCRAAAAVPRLNAQNIQGAVHLWIFPPSRHGRGQARLSKPDGLHLPPFERNIRCQPSLHQQVCVCVDVCVCVCGCMCVDGRAARPFCVSSHSGLRAPNPPPLMCGVVRCCCCAFLLCVLSWSSLSLSRDLCVCLRVQQARFPPVAVQFRC